MAPPFNPVTSNVPPEETLIFADVESGFVLATFDNSNVPLLTVVFPVKVCFEFVNIHVPEPAFVSAVAPPAPSISCPANTLPAVVPVKVSVLFPLPANAVSATTGLLFEKVITPVPDPSIVPPLAPSVNVRLVVSPAPVYCNVPPLITNAGAASDDAPMLLFVKPSANLLTLNV